MSRKEYYELNKEYQICLNNSYDKFFDGHDVDFENLCLDVLDKMKQVGDYYKNMEIEFNENKDKKEYSDFK